MRDTIDMAREAGMLVPGHRTDIEELERFATLVRADEQEKYKWDIHSCGPTCKRYACVAMREAIEAEREACAKVADEWSKRRDDIGGYISRSIRARGETK